MLREYWEKHVKKHAAKAKEDMDNYGCVVQDEQLFMIHLRKMCASQARRRAIFLVILLLIIWRVAL